MLNSQFMNNLSVQESEKPNEVTTDSQKLLMNNLMSEIERNKSAIEILRKKLDMRDGRSGGSQPNMRSS